VMKELFGGVCLSGARVFRNEKNADLGEAGARGGKVLNLKSAENRKQEGEEKGVMRQRGGGEGAPYGEMVKVGDASILRLGKKKPPDHL